MKMIQNYKHNQNTDSQIHETKGKASDLNEEMMKYIKDTKAKLIQNILNYENTRKDKK